MTAIHPPPETEAPAGDILRMTYTEYLAWADEGILAEWVNGEVIVHRLPNRTHQAAKQFLGRLLGIFVQLFDLGLLRFTPFEVKLWPDGPSRLPDLFFLAKENLDRMTDERVIGPPDLVVEVVSDDSVLRDRVDKYGEYEKAGVREYWILDNRPRRQRAQFYQLDATGKYQAIPVGADGIYRSQVLPGFWMRIDWLWQEEPDFLRAVAEVIGPDHVAQALRRLLDDGEPPG